MMMMIFEGLHAFMYLTNGHAESFYSSITSITHHGCISVTDLQESQLKPQIE